MNRYKNFLKYDLYEILFSVFIFTITIMLIQWVHIHDHPSQIRNHDYNLILIGLAFFQTLRMQSGLKFIHLLPVSTGTRYAYYILKGIFFLLLSAVTLQFGGNWLYSLTNVTFTNDHSMFSADYMITLYCFMTLSSTICLLFKKHVLVIIGMFIAIIFGTVLFHSTDHLIVVYGLWLPLATLLTIVNYYILKHWQPANNSWVWI